MSEPHGERAEVPDGAPPSAAGSEAQERAPGALGGVLGLLARATEGGVDVGAIYDRLYEVIDPELGVNIVDLGLVYDVQAGAEGEVEVTMTLTSPGCPLGGYMEDEIDACVGALPGVRSVRVTIVFDPPWDPEKMSDAGREMLGWRG